ncbi:hypothetical protein [Cobetia marina]|uniref:hypothetical protein n=1 Tax=Cobetia marina TaxID=28258 RepID=UPI001144C39A|nr:hypothetical protein [Cobetia marina]GED42357.1 hypothetical protein HHA02_16860 [Cobetia marina]
MNSVSAALAALMDAVSGMSGQFGEGVASHLTSTAGLQREHVETRYQGQMIDFDTLQWRVLYDSVCANQRQNAMAHTRCSQAASEMFASTCQEMTANPPTLPSQRYHSTRRMACHAAVSYQPSIGNIQWAESSGADQLAEAECNAATAALLGSSDLDAIQYQRRVCGGR